MNKSEINVYLTKPPNEINLAELLAVIDRLDEKIKTEATDLKTEETDLKMRRVALNILTKDRDTLIEYQNFLEHF